MCLESKALLQWTVTVVCLHFEDEKYEMRKCSIYSLKHCDKTLCIPHLCSLCTNVHVNAQELNPDWLFVKGWADTSNKPSTRARQGCRGQLYYTNELILRSSDAAVKIFGVVKCFQLNKPSKVVREPYSGPALSYTSNGTPEPVKVISPLPGTEKGDEFHNRGTRSGGRNLQDSSFSLSGNVLFLLACFYFIFFLSFCHVTSVIVTDR